MTADDLLAAAVIVIGLSASLTLAVPAIAKARRGRGAAAARSVVGSYRSALIELASGEDEGSEDHEARTMLYDAPPSTWVNLRPMVIGLLPKVRGSGVGGLSELMRVHGEIDKAQGMLTSRSAVRRAHAAYVLGLVRDRGNASLVMPLLADADADVRLVAARALGAMAEPSAASAVLDAVGTHDGQLGLPAWVAVEALLAMGEEIIPALKDGLNSEDHLVRNVCVVVAGHVTSASVVKELRILLATDDEVGVRVGATVALGLIGRAEDVDILAWLTHASETTVLRRTAVTALGDLGRIEGLDTLFGLLGDGDRRLAQLAADSVVRIGSEGIARLKQASFLGQSPTARVAGAALVQAGLRGQLDTVAAGV